MKKVVIIGGGISGLTAGVYALKAGFSAEIYEKHTVAGGECTGWDRQGYHIDNCIHWLMGAKPGTDLNRIWAETGALDGVEVIGSDHMYTSELDGERVTLWQDGDRTERELLALSPEDGEEIKRLMRYCRMAVSTAIPAGKPPELMGPMDGIKLALGMKDTMKLMKELAGQDVADLAARFRHPLIRRMLSDFCPAESMAQSFPMAYGNFISGDGGIPRGGSRAMAQRMLARFESLGGRFFGGAECERLEVESCRVTSLLLRDGTRVAGDWFVCACDASQTFTRLLGEEYMPEQYREMYARPDAYPIYGMFQAAFAVDSPLDATQGEIMMEAPAMEGGFSSRITVKTYAYEPEFAPKGRQVLQVLWGLSGQAWEYWKALYEDRPAYEARKAELAQGLQACLERRFPEYAGKLSLLDAWTPVTYHRYCNAYRGYNQAFTITKHSARQPYPPAFMKGIENAVLSGQWQVPPGGLPGAAIQGKFAIQRILKKEGQKIEL